MSKTQDVTQSFSAKNNKTPSTTSVGFTFLETKEGEIFHSIYNNYNQLFFLRSGKAVVSCSEGLDKMVLKEELFFLPISAEMTCRALTDCSFLILYFDQLYNVCDRIYFRDLWSICSSKDYLFQTLKMLHPLPQFVNALAENYDPLIETPEYRFVKYEEYLYLFRTIYSKEEMAALFHPIVGLSLEFRKFIMENYLAVKNIEELVELSGLKRKTFDRQFNDEFGIPPYQWILKQKAKHIYYALSETNEQMQEIMKRYGFTIAPHFTRFCKDYFHATPLELRKRFRIAKLNSSY